MINNTFDSRIPKRVYEIYLFTLLFSIPFSNTKGLLPLGELSTDLAAQILLFGTVVHFTFKRVDSQFLSILKHKEHYIIFIFLSLVLLTFFVKYDVISEYFYKGKNGVNRFILQFSLVCTFSLFCSSFLIDLIKIIELDRLKTILIRSSCISLLVVFSYGLIEFCWGVLHIKAFKVFYEYFSVIINKLPSQNWHLGRISSVTQEPPFLAMYLIFVLPWVICYQIKRTTLGTILLIMLFFLTIASKSRTALIIISFQFLLYLFFTINSKKTHLWASHIIIFLCFSIVGLVTIKYDQVESFVKSKISLLSPKKTPTNLSVSNATRFGTQQASLYIFLEEPITGVGLGQQGFLLPKYYSKEDLNYSYELQNYANPQTKVWPPGYSLYTRLLAETGIIGFILFVFFVLLPLIKLILRINLHSEVFPIALIVCYVGLLINAMQFDSFRLTSFWFVFSLALFLYPRLMTVKK